MRIFSRLAIAGLLLALPPYVFMTLVSIAPDNSPVQRRFRPRSGPWAVLFEQRWSFFAPPPLHNNRLYYVFSSPSQGRSLQLEALGEILYSKRQSAPFNEPEAILDYVIHGSVEQLSRYLKDKASLREELRSRTVAAAPAPNTGPEVLPADTRLDALRTLERYAQTVAAANGLPSEYSRVKIIVTADPIPAFADRHRPRSKSAEFELFETTEFDLRS